MPSVIFVCTANRFRSPLAAAILEKALKEGKSAAGRTGGLPSLEPWHVGSAGTWATPGEPVLPMVSEAAQKLGIDLSDHSSRRVSGPLLSEYDLILVMEAGH